MKPSNNKNGSNRPTSNLLGLLEIKTNMIMFATLVQLEERARVNATGLNRRPGNTYELFFIY